MGEVYINLATYLFTMLTLQSTHFFNVAVDGASTRDLSLGVVGPPGPSVAATLPTSELLKSDSALRKSPDVSVDAYNYDPTVLFSFSSSSLALRTLRPIYYALAVTFFPSYDASLQERDRWPSRPPQTSAL